MGTRKGEQEPKPTATFGPDSGQVEFRREGEEAARYPRAREAAGILLELPEHFYVMVDERSD